MKTTERKIIGYKCPVSLYGGEVPKGTLYTPCFNPSYYEPKDIGDVDNKENIVMPKEIVETWEVVYEQEFEVGDIVVITNDVQLGQEGYWIKGHLLKLTDINGDDFSCENLNLDNRTNGFRFSIVSLRKATPEEIKKATEIKIGEYPAKFGKGYVKFGCQSYNLENLKAFQILVSSPVNANITIQGTKITASLLDKIINKMK